MSNIYNIPFSSNFIDQLISYIASDFDNLEQANNALIIFPSRRLQREFHKKITSQKNKQLAFLPKSLVYSDIVDNFIEFSDICDQDLHKKTLKYNRLKIIEDAELDIILKIVIKSILQEKNFSRDIVSNIGLANIKQAISEYYYYEYNIDKICDVLNIEKELFFIEIIKKLDSYFKEQNCILKQQLQTEFSRILKETWSYQAQKNIYSIVPLTDVVYIMRFLEILSKYKNAKIFIHGLDKNLSDDLWENLDDKHNQHYIKKFLSIVNIPRGSVKDLASVKPFDQYLSYITYPNDYLYYLHNKNDFELSQNIEFIEGANQSQEARLVTLAIKENINNYKDIAIVTANKSISKKIKYYLSEWNIKVDDFILNGEAESAELKMFYMILEYFSSYSNEIHLFLDILKHPLCEITDLSQDKILEFELNFLRKMPNKPDFQNYFDEMNKGEKAKFQKIKEVYFMLEKNKNSIYRSRSISEILHIHLKTLYYFLIKYSEDANGLKEITRFQSDLLHLKLSNYELDFADYKEIILNLIATIKPQNDLEKYNVKMFEVMETRFIRYDLVFFIGLNEGVFPLHKEDHGLISKFAREKTNVRQVTSELGYAEATFLNILSSKKVFLSYSKGSKNNSMKSRYLERFLLGFKLKNSRLPVNLYYQDLDNERHKQKSIPIKRSSINPKLNNRPSKISVSGIESLILDPYVYYIKYILKLYPLEKICYLASNREFGVLVHNLLAFISQNENYKNFKGHNDIYDLIKSEVSKITLEDGLSEFWIYRLEKIINWLKENHFLNDDSIRKQLIEAKGSMRLQINNKDIYVTAVADRIDYTEGDMIRIMDYKTGYVPKSKEVECGIYPQLMIEELILKNGQFYSNNRDIKGYEIELSYLKLSGKKEQPCEKVKIKTDINNAINGLIQLLEKFLCKENDYFAMPNANVKNSQYLHLSRLQEWVFEVCEK